MPYKDPEAQKAHSRAYREANKEKKKQQGAVYYEANKERILERSAEYYKKNSAAAINRSAAYYKANREKCDAQNKAWAKANPDKVKIIQARSRVKRRDKQAVWTRSDRFGINDRQYQELLRLFPVCAICGKPPGSKALDIDHDHSTGVVRGLLCNNCNRGLGRLKDSPSLLREAALYLECAKPDLSEVA